MTNFAQARHDMIEGQLRSSGVLDANVLAAIAQIPREEFLQDSQKGFAYVDKDHKVGDSPLRYMGAPVPGAKLIELAEVTPNDIVLDIACGSGYSTAVLAHLANSVVAVETSAALVESANETLSRLNISNAAVVQGDLARGAPGEAPFDVIIIEGAVGEVPKTLLDQLRDGGRLVALLGNGASATAVSYVKNQSGITRVPSFNACLPELEEFAVPEEFIL